jgi:multicomponent Na+:H+ antiporter subunit D
MLSFFVIAPVLAAVVLYILPLAKSGKVIAAAIQASLAVLAFSLFWRCKQGEIVSAIGNYRGVTGIVLKADTLSSVFVALVSFLFLIVVLYSFNDNADRLFWFFLLIWQGLLNGIFLSRDLFHLFVLVEVVTVVVSVMIMFNRDNRSMYDGMLYLMVNSAAIQFYLLGAGYLYKLTASLDMDAVAAADRHLDPSSLVLPFALIMTMVCMKCALMPLYSWLPRAHGTPGAPTAVSAVLSGLHIKSAVYLFIRFHHVFEDIFVPEFFVGIGIITGIAGFIFALSQSDIKLILAYHTISQIGMIMIGLNLSNSYANTGGIYHMINHALFKSALFLCAGMIAQAYGTRNIYEIRGVLRRMPLVGAATVMAILGITGAPFFNGSISKYFIMAGAGRAVSAALIFINLGTIISFIKYSSMLFGHAVPAGGALKIDGFKQATVLVLGVLCFAGGIFGEEFIHFLFNINVAVDAAGYFEKTLLFAASGIAGFLIYKYYVRRSKLLKHVKAFALGFRGICALVGAFFAVLLIISKLML